MKKFRVNLKYNYTISLFYMHAESKSDDDFELNMVRTHTRMVYQP